MQCRPWAWRSSCAARSGGRFLVAVVAPEGGFAHGFDETHMRGHLVGIEAWRQGCRTLWCRGARDEQVAGPADAKIVDQGQGDLTATDQLEVDIGEDLAVEQRAVERAAGI